MEEKRKTRISIPKIVAVVIVILLVAAVAAVLYICRDDLSVEGVKKKLSSLGAAETRAEEFYYTAGDGRYGELDGGIIVVAPSQIQAFDKDGKEIYNETVAMTRPGVYANGERAVAYDAGGMTVRVVDSDGGLMRPDIKAAVISASVNKNGWFAVCTEESGYGGSVNVFNAEGGAVYKWYSGDGYVLSAEVSPDNKSIAVLSATGSGSRVTFVHLSGSKEHGRYDLDGSILFDIKYLDNKKLAAVCDSGLHIMDTDGNLSGKFEFNGLYLNAFSFGEQFTALALSEYRGTEGTLYLIGPDGTEIASAAAPTEVISVSALGKYFAVLYRGNGAEIYDSGMNILAVFDNTASATHILMRPDGDATLAAPYSAQVFSVPRE